MRKQIADGDATFAVLAKLPGRFQNLADIGKLSRFKLSDHLVRRPTIVLVEHLLGVKRVDLRWPAIHIQEDDILGLGGKMSRSGRKRTGVAA